MGRQELYRYAFELSREGNQKSLDIDTARNLLQLLLSDRWPNLPYFLTFLRVRWPCILPHLSLCTPQDVYALLCRNPLTELSIEING